MRRHYDESTLRDRYAETSYPNAKQAARFSPKAGSGLQPKKEITTLEDYRQRYALYRRDPGLQALHASAPSIAIW